MSPSESRSTPPSHGEQATSGMPRMSLRSKIVLIVSLVVGLYATGDHAIQRATMIPSFAALERDEALTDMRRVVEAIGAEIAYLDRQCKSRASWDETWRFVAGTSDAERERYIASNLGPRSFADNQIDLLYVCDPAGGVEWGEVRDWRRDEELELRDLPGESLAPGHAYLVTEDVPRSHEIGSQRGYISGLVQTENGPMLLASRPILKSDGTGPIRGTLILGRFLNSGLIEELRQRTSVEIALWPLDSPALPAPEGEVLPKVTSSTEPVIEERGAQDLDVYTTLEDMRRAPSLLVRARIPRDISARGASAAEYALVSTVAAGVLLLLVLLGVLQRTVLTPVAKLTRHAVYIGQTEDSTVKLELAEGRQDEVGVLYREFDSMLTKLARSRAAVIDTARKAGMSDIANGILHNVGNVLNSVNVSAGMVNERLRSSRVGKLERLNELVEQHADDLGGFLVRDPKGRHFAPFLGELTRLMRTDQVDLEREMGTLSEGIEHIRHLVSSQQAYAGRSALREATDVSEALENALRLSEQATPGARPIAVERRFEALSGVRLDHHKLMEILVNVLKNAREALDEQPRERRILLVLRKEARPEDGQRLVIEVADSGPGIPPENLTRIFNNGFTTKPHGQGIGLHVSANAAKEMDGKLGASARGEAGGATFVLDLPFEPAAAVSGEGG